ncbi:2-nitroimidazole nitrohydrolase [Clostridium luticellarii]|uniref:2-nitroimidazole nitrohydrolase n=2 Tax=Clostridium luticellarii TaxID=1691940 RepID=A0A2T0BP87_9CLOT|nr:arginine deiminase family protein [Clostridium luticellarii]PRR85689.1 2-nitroimidazole nitrohydrolase [Clostridium luticellarii]
MNTKMSECFVRNSTASLKKVLMCPPTYAYLKKHTYGEDNGIRINGALCMKEHEELVDAYRSNGVEVVLMKPDHDLHDQVFARDFGASIREGYILGNFRIEPRKSETQAYRKKMEELGIPCVARCSRGHFEGGDFWMLDDSTIAIGILERTDELGVEEIKQQIARYGYEVIGVKSPEKCLHLDMCFNIVAEKLAVICSEVLPGEFLDILKDRNFKLIEVDRDNLLRCHCNLQALGNEKVVSFRDNRKVNSALRSYGIEVIEPHISEMFKHGGGIHCMTFPLKRK